MKRKNVIRVFEFERVFYDDSKPFKQKHWQKLCNYLDTVNKPDNQVAFFRILNKGIQFTNYVGVIQVGNLTIEVLPKIDRTTITALNGSVEELEMQQPETARTKNQWQQVLIDMLRECRRLQINQVDLAHLNLKSNSILELYLEIFLSEAEKLLRDGLIKKYIKEQGNRTALKGQLLFPKQLAYNHTHQERFYVKHTSYSQNNIFNQIILKTIKLVAQLTHSNHLLDQVNRLLLDYPGLDDIDVDESTFNLPFDRKTERYKEAILICKMLLLNYRPDIAGGTENIIAILFDMNKLWEEFVYRRLKEEETRYRISVSGQSSKQFWIPTGYGYPKSVRPDIVIKYSTREVSETVVIDTKWKNLQQLTPSDEDLKQIFVYNLLWNCRKGVLLYPATQSLSGIGDYSLILRDIKGNSCSVEGVTVLEPGKGRIKQDFAKEILEKVIGSNVLNLLEK